MLSVVSEKATRGHMFVRALRSLEKNKSSIHSFATKSVSKMFILKHAKPAHRQISCTLDRVTTWTWSKKWNLLPLKCQNCEPSSFQ